MSGFARRPQLQERLTNQIADAIMERLDARGVLVVLQAEHTCMNMRGIKAAGSETVTSATPASVEDVFLDQCAEAGVVPTLLLPERLEDAASEMGKGEPREHAHFPHASYVITKRPTRIGAPLELTVLIDACHNPQSVATFLTAVRAVEPDPAARPLLLCAALADKDCKGMVELLTPEFPRVACTQTSSARALAAEDLAELFREAGANVVATYPSVAVAKDALANEAYVACGSITLAGELAGLF